MGRRLYIAGPYSANNVITVLDNMRNGMRVAVEALLEGFSPFTPWHDYHFQLSLIGNEKLCVEHYYRFSMDWLEASDAIYVLNGYETSKGTLAEIGRADELSIPVYYQDDITLKELAKIML